MKLELKRKAQISLWFVYMILAVIIVVTVGIFAPMGVLFNSEIYAAGDTILANANASLNNISDPEIKAQLQGMIGEARNAGETNIEVNSDIFQYGWVVLLFVTALVIFLFTRQLVETSGRGGIV